MAAQHLAICQWLCLPSEDQVCLPHDPTVAESALITAALHDCCSSARSQEGQPPSKKLPNASSRSCTFSVAFRCLHCRIKAFQTAQALHGA